MDHRPSPDHGGVFRDEKSHGDEFDAVTFSRSDLTVLLFRGLGHAHHHGNVRAVDIRIEQPDLSSSQGHGYGEINGNSGFADSAFAAADGDDVFDAGNEVVFPVTGLGFSGMCISHEAPPLHAQANKTGSQASYSIISEGWGERKWVY